MSKFVTFEGGEGCGKTTLLEGLKAYLNQHNVDYVATREPGGLKICEEIRNMVKYSTEEISKRAELLLFSASRAELVQNYIVPNLKAGKLVLCDRFYDSSRVYQGYANGLSDEEVMNVTKFATNGLVPDITFYLDIDPKVAFERKGGKDKGDRIEQRDLSYHYMVREGYKKIAEKEDRFVIIDATLSKQEVLEIVLNKLRKEGIIE